MIRSQAVKARKKHAAALPEIRSGSTADRAAEVYGDGCFARLFPATKTFVSDFLNIALATLLHG